VTYGDVLHRQRGRARFSNAACISLNFCASSPEILIFIIIEIRFNVTYMIKHFRMPERIKVQNKKEISMLVQVKKI
jgi:hypothetical protein